METVDVRGFPVEIHKAGSGPPLLYLHAEQYCEQVRPHLDALAKTWTVIAPRHPGYGAASLRATCDRSTISPISISISSTTLKLDDVVLVGASLGGWIALEMCVRNHARLSKLVLVSSVGVKFAGREERDFADLFYLPDDRGVSAAVRRPEAACAELRSDVLPTSSSSSRASATCSPTMAGDRTCTIPA